MNARQRRKLIRKLCRNNDISSQRRFIRDWDDLAQVPESETHYLEIDAEGGSGWIKSKDKSEFMGKYLSTHTFYSSNFLRSTRLLQRCGFNVILANWDKTT